MKIIIISLIYYSIALFADLNGAPLLDDVQAVYTNSITNNEIVDERTTSQVDAAGPIATIDVQDSSTIVENGQGVQEAGSINEITVDSPSASPAVEVADAADATDAASQVVDSDTNDPIVKDEIVSDLNASADVQPLVNGQDDIVIDAIPIVSIDAADAPSQASSTSSVISTENSQPNNVNEVSNDRDLEFLANLAHTIDEYATELNNANNEAVGKILHNIETIRDTFEVFQQSLVPVPAEVAPSPINVNPIILSPPTLNGISNPIIPNQLPYVRPFEPRTSINENTPSYIGANRATSLNGNKLISSLTLKFVPLTVPRLIGSQNIFSPVSANGLQPSSLGTFDYKQQIGFGPVNSNNLSPIPIDGSIKYPSSYGTFGFGIPSIKQVSGSSNYNYGQQPISSFGTFDYQRQ